MRGKGLWPAVGGCGPVVVAQKLDWHEGEGEKEAPWADDQTLGLCFSAGAPRFPLCFTLLCVCSALMPKNGACSGEETTGAGVPGSTQSSADLGGLLFCLHSQMSLSLGFNLDFFGHTTGAGGLLLHLLLLFIFPLCTPSTVTLKKFRNHILKTVQVR